MVRIKGLGSVMSMVLLLVFSACGSSNNNNGNPSAGRVGITLTASPASLYANGSTSAIFADVRNSRDNSPVADGTELTFSLETPLGSTIYPTSPTPTTNGMAQVIFTSGTQSGTVTVKALSGTVSKTVDVTLTTPPAGQQVTNLVIAQVWATPASIPIYGKTDVSAEIRDTQGNLASDGQEVDFSSALPGSSIDASVTTLGGLATAVFSSDFRSWSAGATITVKAGTATDKSLKIKVLDLYIQQVTVSAGVVPPGGTATIQAEILDTDQNLAADDTEVTFSSGLLGSSVDSLVKTVGGLARAKFTAGDISGTAVITVKVGKNAVATANLTVGVSNATITASATPNRISIGKTSLVEVVVMSGGALVTDGMPVYFSTNMTGAVITPMAKTLSGMAQSTFTAGTKGGTATITIKCGNIVINNLTIGVIGDVASIQVFASPATISVLSSSSILADVRDSANNPVVDGTEVSFSTDMSSASITQTKVQTAGGQATTTFKSGSGFGNAKITATAGSITNNSRIITISPPRVSSIEFVSATPQQVGVKGSGLTEVSIVTFTVKDDHGNPAPDGTSVNFFLYGPKGGESISPPDTATDKGEAITYLQAGTVSGPVRIEATTVNSLTSSSIGIAIGSGLPSYRNFSVAIANGAYNMPGLDCYGLSAQITAFMADRYYNFVGENTSADFYTESGAISPTAWSDPTGRASATYQTQGPAPKDQGPAAFYQCGGVDDLLAPCAPERSSTDYLYGPHHTFNPRDGVSTILITTIGEEEFDDKNGNGVYDAEPFTDSNGNKIHDTGEPFTDSNGNGVYDAEPFVDLSEPFLDANDNGVYDYAEPFTDGVDIYGNIWNSKVNGKYDPPTPWMDVNLSDNPDGDGLSGECDGVPVTGEDSGKVGNTSTQVVMTGTTLANLPVIPGTVTLYNQILPSNYVIDDGMGHISTLTKVNRAVIDYATGKITGTVTFPKTIGAGNQVTVDYQYGTSDCNNRWDVHKICLGDLENPNRAIDCKTNPNAAGCVCFPGEKFWDKWMPGQTHGNGIWDDAEFYVDYNPNHKFDGPNGVWDAHTMIWKSVNQLITGVSEVRKRIRKLDQKTGYASFCGAGGNYVWGDDCYYPLAITIPNGSSNLYLLEVSDINFNPLDKLSISFAGTGCKVSDSGEAVDDPVDQGWTYFVFMVYDADPTNILPIACSLDYTISWSNCSGATFSKKDTLSGYCE